MANDPLQMYADTLPSIEGAKALKDIVVDIRLREAEGGCIFVFRLIPSGSIPEQLSIMVSNEIISTLSPPDFANWMVDEVVLEVEKWQQT